eukprot:291891_1
MNHIRRLSQRIVLSNSNFNGGIFAHHNRWYSTKEIHKTHVPVIPADNQTKFEYLNPVEVYVKEHDEDLKKYRQNLNDIEIKLTEMKSLWFWQKNQIAQDAQKDINEIVKQIDETQKKLLLFCNQVKEVSNANYVGLTLIVQEQAMQIRAWEKSHKLLFDQHNNLTNGFEELRTNNTQLDREHQFLKGKFDELEKDKNKISIKKDALKAENKTLQTEYEALKKEKDTLTTNYKIEQNELVTEIKTWEESHKLLFDEHNDLKDRFGALKKEQDTLATNYNDLKTEQNELDIRYNTLKTNHSKLKVEHTNLNDELTQSQTINSELQNDKKELKSICSRWESEYNILESEHNQLKYEENELKNSYSATAGDCVFLTTQYNQLQFGHNKLDREYVELDIKHEKLEENHNDLMGDFKISNDDCKFVTEKYNLLQHDMNSLHIKSSALDVEYEELKNKNTQNVNMLGMSMIATLLCVIVFFKQRVQNKRLLSSMENADGDENKTLHEKNQKLITANNSLNDKIGNMEKEKEINNVENEKLKDKIANMKNESKEKQENESDYGWLTWESGRRIAVGCVIGGFAVYYFRD